MVTKVTIPSKSKLNKESDLYNYIDSYYYPLKRKDVEAWELVSAFFLSAPKWVDHLMVIRNRLVSLIGLKVGIVNPALINPPYSKGQKIGVFEIQEISKDEVLLGQKDKHLDFKTSLLVTHENNPELVISTIVRINNIFGEIYFYVVKPVHRIIVPIMIKRMARILDKA